MSYLFSNEGEDLIDDINSLIRFSKICFQLLRQRNETIFNIVKLFVDRKGFECLKISIDTNGLQNQYEWKDENVNMCFHLLTELKIIWSVLEVRYYQILFAESTGTPKVKK